jgi:hypothetical protein
MLLIRFCQDGRVQIPQRRNLQIKRSYDIKF